MATENQPPIVETEFDAITISKLAPAQVFTLIESEVNIDQLKDWQQEEATNKKRTTILNAIALQIKSIEGGQL